jgi:hypothetical protein
MSTDSPVAVSVAAAPKSVDRPVALLRSWDRRFYVLITIVLIGIVARGFWPSYYGQIFSGGGRGRAWIMHLHGAVFTGWMALQLLQVGLVAAGRIGAHRRVGAFGIYYGALLFVVGLIVSFAAPVMHVRAGEWPIDQAAGFMILPLVDMVLFGGFFAGAVFYRQKPEIHKRLILAATVSVAFAAVARMQIQPPALFYLAWISPMLLGMGYDLFSRKRVHPVYWVCLAAMSLAFVRIFAMTAEPWLKFARALLAPFV